MAKTSKTIPQKEHASSSQSTADKTPVEPRLDKCVPGACVLISDFKVDKGVGKDTVLRSSPVEEEASTFVPNLVKDNKRKRASTSEVPKPRKNTIPLTIESVLRLRDEEEEEENDGSVLVARVKKTIDDPKAAESMVIYKVPPRTEEISKEGLGRVPESLEIEDASHRNQQTQKLEVIGKLREEVNMIRAEILEWKDGMDRLAAEKEIARAQLSSAKKQLQSMKEKSSIQARKIEELKARLASELAKAKSDVEKAKANANALDAEAAQVHVREAAETANT
ncbi:protein WEAK CHLOROPLAST MOVEMENT UNDER BLUE LIGHT-like 1 [Nicotiana tomentosiformis]|uniref:protein WEAK CHLOROPLAST MOVEMENT UNDER BLUE LIGHT-like 1 n=1 Tax=Nicotiana tomentosiformis TaxID=4098 RepID=UPI00388C6B27